MENSPKRKASEDDVEKLGLILSRGRLTNDQFKRLVHAMVSNIDESELTIDDGSSEAKLKRFLEISTHMRPKSAGRDTYKYVRFMIEWAKVTDNPHLHSYLAGLQDGALLNKADRTKKAANGRIKIGQLSKEKVLAASANWRHLSKERAAEKIAAIAGVGLSTGRVRRMLSELFPGESWR
jgi:hypothetical protein